MGKTRDLFRKIRAKVRGRSWEDPMPEGRQPRGVTLHPRPGAVAWRSHPVLEARGGGREEQPHVQVAVATQGQEGLVELSHVEDQEGRW